jgi:hypothetical protein
LRSACDSDGNHLGLQSAFVSSKAETIAVFTFMYAAVVRNLVPWTMRIDLPGRLDRIER